MVFPTQRDSAKLDDMSDEILAIWNYTANQIPLELLNFKFSQQEIESEIVNTCKMIYLHNELLTAYTNHQLRLMNFLQDNGILMKEENAPVVQITCKQINDNLVKITINNVLPHMPKALPEKHYRLLRDTWTPLLLDAIMKEKPNISFKKSFIYIEQTFPDTRVRDTDNRFRTFIFDSLKKAKIIQDDGIDNLVTMDYGLSKKGVNKTEIYITEFDLLGDFLQKKGIIKG